MTRYLLDTNIVSDRVRTPQGRETQTISLGPTLDSDNEREFARIPELPFENWLR